MIAPQRSAALQTFRPIPRLTLATTAGEIASALSEQDFMVEALFASNLTATAASITMHLVEPGGTPAAANQIMAARTVAANGTSIVFDRDAPCLIPPGYSLQALASAAGAIATWGHGVDIAGVWG